MSHIKQHLVCWRFTMKGISTFHMQHYLTKQIAMDKAAQLRQDRAYVRPDDILYRCVVFKFSHDKQRRVKAHQ